MEFDKTRYAGVVPPIQDQLDPPNPVLGLWRIRAWSCSLFQEKHRKGEYWSYRQSHCVIVATIQVLLALCEEKERPIRPLPRVFQIGCCFAEKRFQNLLPSGSSFAPRLYLAVVKQASKIEWRVNFILVGPRVALVLLRSGPSPSG